MLESEALNMFDAIVIKLANPQSIKAWSTGEVKKPETINYRTLKPEKDGLFCEKIFGPTRDWECNCGKYKRVKHKGITCDRCGVEVTLSKVRRERMGHIQLATPVSHIWFFKIMPSRMGNILDMSMRELEKVIYYEEYVVIDPGETPLKKRELLNEERYTELQEKFAGKFVAKMGAEAIKDLLKEVDLDKSITQIKKSIKSSKGDQISQVSRKNIKRFKILEDFKSSENKPEWMIIDVLPVLPPDLRPLVPLDGGRFATSDLNDLYRRVINRNNRLKKLLELNAPDVIVRNEKRMLQEAVDALLDNGRHGRAVVGPGNRPLKSLSDMLKGKQGRFRQNLLGKRVDYSGRSVIVIGPELKLHQCGLPKKMALELFEPFIIRKLKERGYVHTIKSAKKMVERTRTEVWDILEEVIKEHPVLLNRAPTLHRLGIQAFQPILIEGKAIRVHPLVCAAFNADFDGDQMAVHVPLSIEAQMEAKLLMMSVNNIFSPSDGRPIMSPSQDIVLGCYYLTSGSEGATPKHVRSLSSPEEVIVAYEDGGVKVHEPIKVRLNGESITTTPGRVIFNQLLPDGATFVNEPVSKSILRDIIEECYNKFGHNETVKLLDRIKEKGFMEATKAGISLAVDDLQSPIEKAACIDAAKKEVVGVEKQYQQGLITERERYNKIIDIWTHTTDNVSDLIFMKLSKFNPLFMMAESGARGSRQQIRQLAGMRGLMAKPSGEIIESPITANFREGLTVLEYFISSHGARKGLADTALKTADSGYLTRRLVDVAQEVIITEEDCGTVNGILIGAIIEGDDVVVSLKERIVGRVALDNIVDVVTDTVLVAANTEIRADAAEKIESAGIEKIRIRSVLTCETKVGVCAKCYGRNLATGRMIELGEAVGIIAAQSIGEPGTQLTMRTFHIGGTASRIVEQSHIVAKNSGVIKYHSLRIVKTKTGEIIVINRNGQISINEPSGRELERYTIPSGAVLRIDDGKKVEKGDIFIRWDPYTSPILTEVEGWVIFEDIKEEVTMRKEADEATGLTERVIIEHKGDYRPQIVIRNENGDTLAVYSLPAGVHIVIQDKQKVEAGSLIAKTPRKITKTKDITGGLPRVAELFEARRPKDPAIISEIDGEVEFGPLKKGQRCIIIKSSTDMRKEYLIPHGKHIEVYKGDHVISGQKLIDGPEVLQDILRVCGDKVLQEYLLNEVQEVYRLQGVRINDKHIEIIVRQMLKKVVVFDPGDTKLLVGSYVDKTIFQEENEKAIKKQGKPASATPLLLGITKASLTTQSFISAASFQETTRILAEAATSGRRDELKGLKENVIMGHLIPAGTGFVAHRKIEVIRAAFVMAEAGKKEEASEIDAEDISEEEVVKAENSAKGKKVAKEKGKK